MKLSFVIIFVLLLSSVSVLGQEVNVQRSEGGNAVMTIDYDKPVVVRQDGLQANFKHSFRSIGVNQWEVVTCPLPSRDSLPSQLVRGLANTPLFSEVGNPTIPDFIDMSEGCLSFDITAFRGDRFKIGQASTVIEIQNATAQFVVTPEYQSCSYLVCESFIELNNLDNADVTFPALSLFVHAENQINTSVFSVDSVVPVFVDYLTLDNETILSKETGVRNMVVERNIEQNDTLIIGAGDTARFRIVTEFGEPKKTFKYNVSFFYVGTEFLIDPFFTTRDSNFSAGTFQTTFLNPSGYVQIPVGFFSGTYYSEIFDVGGNANLTNITWWQEVNYGADLPNFLGGEVGHFVSLVNMTDNIILFHFNNDTQENDTFVRNWASDLFNLSCDVGADECPTLVADSVFNKSYEFDGVDDHFESNNFTVADTGNESFSVSLWVNTTENLNRVILAKRTGGTGFEITVRSSGVARFLIDEQTQPSIFVTGDTVITDGKWHHIVAVRDSENALLRIYVDGVEDAIPVDEGSVDSLSNTLQLSIGAESSGQSAFNGQIDEVGGWLVVLSGDRIREQYLRGGVTLTPYVRSCNDRFCFNDDLIDVFGTSVAALNISDNERYFQYVFNFTNLHGIDTPKLYNVSLGYDVGEILGGLVVGECPSDTPNIILLWIVTLIALVLIGFGFASNAGFFGVFGGLMLLIISWFLVGCSSMFGYSIAVFGLVTVMFFALNSVFGRREGY